MSRGARLFLAICLLLVAAPARAEGDPDGARRHYQLSQQLYAKGKYTEALAELQAARAAFDRPELDYNIGLCLEKLDRPGEAADALERFINAKPDDSEALQIWKKIAALRAKSPKPAATAGEPPPPPPPPPPAAVAENPPPPPPPREPTFLRSPRGIAAISVAGVGVLALLSSAVTGGLALSTKDSYHASCNGITCNDGLYNQAHSLGIATDVMIAVGVAAAATTLALVFTRPKGVKFALTPSVGPNGGGLAFGGSL